MIQSASPASFEYNCIAFAYGREDKWFEPSPLGEASPCNANLKRRIRRTARRHFGAVPPPVSRRSRGPGDLCASRRRFRPRSVESASPAKKKKEPRVPLSASELRPTGVGPALQRPALAAYMVAAGQPSRRLHTSGPQTYGALDLSAPSTVHKAIASNSSHTAIGGLNLGATLDAFGEAASVAIRE